ncbi:hypothetical protein B0T21DRAFT_189436 [Apiosordaria backusii]|uniref:Uncharacterized protein n=1 Tax=Apiosordaria backusii TaxID=314023 RepID=A0AA40BJY7_9PEZI|nr:hypothetical protein B0T21DRAFT_189436 [Apiosordaria backusii]
MLLQARGRHSIACTGCQGAILLAPLDMTSPASLFSPRLTPKLPRTFPQVAFRYSTSSRNTRYVSFQLFQMIPGRRVHISTPYASRYVTVALIYGSSDTDSLQPYQLRSSSTDKLYCGNYSSVLGVSFHSQVPPSGRVFSGLSFGSCTQCDLLIRFPGYFGKIATRRSRGPNHVLGHGLWLCRCDRTTSWPARDKIFSFHRLPSLSSRSTQRPRLSVDLAT